MSSPNFENCYIFPIAAVTNIGEGSSRTLLPTILSRTFEVIELLLARSSQTSLALVVPRFSHRFVNDQTPKSAFPHSAMSDECVRTRKLDQNKTLFAEWTVEEKSGKYTVRVID